MYFKSICAGQEGESKPEPAKRTEKGIRNQMI